MWKKLKWCESVNNYSGESAINIQEKEKKMDKNKPDA